MKLPQWPWVSRALYESAVARAQSEREVATMLRHDLARHIDQWAGLLAVADAKYDDLLARYHMLRLQGHVAVPPPAEPKANPIQRAIARKSGGDAELMEMMERQAAQDKADGMNEAEILLAIQLGHSAIEEGAML